MIIGYTTITTRSEDTAKLKLAGCETVRTKLPSLAPEDTVCVVNLDRLGNSTRDVLKLVLQLAKQGMSVRVLEPAITTNRTILPVLQAVLDAELAFIKQRQRAGIERAKAEGVYEGVGRPVSLDHEMIRQLHSQGVGPSEIAKRMGCARSAVYKVIKGVTKDQDRLDEPPSQGQAALDLGRRQSRSG